MNIKPDKPVFYKRLQIVLPYLPKYYGVVYKIKFPPDVDIEEEAYMAHMYSVVNRGVVDWEVLSRLVAIAKEHRNRLGVKFKKRIPKQKLTAEAA